jgi:hypothetical protein
MGKQTCSQFCNELLQKIENKPSFETSSTKGPNTVGFLTLNHHIDTFPEMQCLKNGMMYEVQQIYHKYF